MLKTLFLIGLLFLLSLDSLFSSLSDFNFSPQRRRLIFVEDYYKLYRRGLYHNTDNHLANIYNLKIALRKAETNRWWAHPAKVFSYAGYDWVSSRQLYTEAHHAKYKELMKLRLSLLITKNYLSLGSRYDKENIYWFNIDRIEANNNKEHYLKRGFKIARVCYREAARYFFKTKEYARKLVEDKYKNKRLSIHDDKKLARTFSAAPSAAPSATTSHDSSSAYDEISYSSISLDGPEISSMEDDAYKIYFGGGMLEVDAPFIKDKIKLKIGEDKYLAKVKIYKEEKHYYNKSAYPEYNYSKVIREKLLLLKEKEAKLDSFLAKLK